MGSLPLKIKPNSQTLILAPFLHFSSTLPPFSDQNPIPDHNSSSDPNANPQSSHSSSSLFSDIKQRLRSLQPPPLGIPNYPPPPPTSHAPSLDEIRKHLAEFCLRDPNPNPTQGCPVSFQELFKNNNAAALNLKPERVSFDPIWESLGQFRPTGAKDPQMFQRANSASNRATGRGFIDWGSEEPARVDIWEGDEGEDRGEGKGEGTKELKTEFVKKYGPEELGGKLRRLRPADAQKGGKDWFSLEELNVRLAKLRELEEKETELRMGGVSFSDLRRSLMKLKDAENNKKVNMQRMSILANIGLQTTLSYMLKPPQEQPLENSFHPDHMSSAEKMKLERKKVRDEFKMSESDCGSVHVQIAQLTTKIKHLSSVLHKKDKHSRKGLNEMVQRRKKLLKYLRRTDWDSYCFVLSKLGLRDVPEYKVPDYKC